MRPSDWMDDTLAVIHLLSHTYSEFTTDWVWLRVQEYPKERRMMGVAMKAAQALGYIFPTNEYRPSTRPECHGRPVRVWRSRAWEKGKAA